MTIEGRSSPTLNKNIFVLIALIFIYIDYALFIASPGILIAIFTFFYFSPWLVKNASILLAIVVFGLVVTLRKEHSVLELGKFLFMCGSFMLILHYRSKTKFPFIVLGLFFVVELVLRIIHGNIFGGLYAIKSSGGLFQDSNFTGLFLAAILAAIFSYHRPMRKYSFSPIRVFSLVFFGVLLLMTFSRTSIIFFFFLIITKYSLKLGLLAFLATLIIIVVTFIQPSLSLEFIDGSLETKRKIFLGFVYVLSGGVETILFGVGRDGAFEVTQELTGATYAGHTIFGQIVEFGLILTSLYYYTAFLFIKKLYGNDHVFILIPILAISILGLSPLSYLGILCFLYYFTGKSMGHVQMRISNERVSGVNTKA